MKVVAVIPAYNEERSVEEVVRKTRKHVDEIIVVDDGSTDRTSEIARKEGAIVIRHKVNLGLGCALRSGIREALKRKADVIVTIDADGQHDPNDIPKLLEKIREGYDFVIGRRNLRVYPLIKKIGNFILNFLTNLISGTTLSDTESGFRAFNKKAAMLFLSQTRESGYAIASEMVIIAGHRNLKCANVNVSSPIYVKGVTVRDGFRIFFHLIRRRKRNLLDYLRDFKIVVKLWLRGLMKEKLRFL